MRLGFFLFGIVICFSLGAQANLARSAFGRLQKQEFSAARQLLQKSMRKDVGLAQHYTWAWYYSYPANGDFQVDSASYHVRKAWHAWRAADAEARTEWGRFPIDSVRLVFLAHRIDSLAFDRARAENTEAAYVQFIEHFPGARQVSLAAELAAEVSFLQALAAHTVESYVAYLTRYPQSGRAEDARARLDKLQFERETKSATLKAFQDFYRTYPGNRYRSTAVEKIFQLQTASGRATDLQMFVEDYRDADIARHAAALLFYLDTARQSNRNLFPDSLLRLQELNIGYWIPFLQNGKFGFLNQQGDVVMPEQFSRIPMAYRCQPITSDFIMADDQLFLRNGRLLAREPVTKVDEIGGGFVLMHLAHAKKILHKTGFTFLADVEAAKWVAGQYLAARQRGRWGLFSVNGLPLVAAEYEDIDAIHDVLVLHRNGKRMLVHLSELPRVAEGATLNQELVYDDVKAWGQGRLWVKTGSLEGVLNKQLQFELPLGRQRLVRTSFGHMQTAAGRTTLAGLGEEIARASFQRVVVADPWLVTFRDGGRDVFSIPARRFLAQALDSVWFLGTNAWARRNDSTFLFSATRLVTAYPEGAALEFIPSPDSVRTFFLTEKNRKSVYALQTGKKIFTAAFDKIQQADGYFIVTWKNKRGLLDEFGKTVLPAEYDEVVYQPPKLFSLVKNKMFGWYDAELQRLTKPVYDRNVHVLGAELLVTGQGGRKGVILRSGKIIFPFELEDVKRWTDSLLWIRKNQLWQLVDWRTGRVAYDRVRSFQPLFQSEDEICVLVKRDGGEGVFSSVQGELIPPTFSEVMYLGDEFVPFYLAAKNVYEAGLVVVAYFDRNGKRVRRHAYDDAEIEQLVCDED